MAWDGGAVLGEGTGAGFSAVPQEGQNLGAPSRGEPQLKQNLAIFFPPLRWDVKWENKMKNLCIYIVIYPKLKDNRHIFLFLHTP